MMIGGRTVMCISVKSMKMLQEVVKRGKRVMCPIENSLLPAGRSATLHDLPLAVPCEVMYVLYR